MLRRETRALRSGVEAAKEAEARAWRKMEDVKAAEQAALQREQLLQRQALDLRERCEQLRSQLEAAQEPVNGMDQVASELNKKLEAKVQFLREELALWLNGAWKRKELEREKAQWSAWPGFNLRLLGVGPGQGGVAQPCNKSTPLPGSLSRTRHPQATQKAEGNEPKALRRSARSCVCKLWRSSPSQQPGSRQPATMTG